MERRRPVGVRVSAALAAAALAFGLPVLIVLLAVVGDRWRPLVGILIVVLIAVSVAAWFFSRARPTSEGGDHPPTPDDGVSRARPAPRR
jgi:hypothetical protein